jgi:hypothetical protein
MQPAPFRPSFVTVDFSLPGAGASSLPLSSPSSPIDSFPGKPIRRMDEEEKSSVRSAASPDFAARSAIAQAEAGPGSVQVRTGKKRNFSEIGITPAAVEQGGAHVKKLKAPSEKEEVVADLEKSRAHDLIKEQMAQFATAGDKLCAYLVRCPDTFYYDTSFIPMLHTVLIAFIKIQRFAATAYVMQQNLKLLKFSDVPGVEELIKLYCPVIDKVKKTIVSAYKKEIETIQHIVKTLSADDAKKEARLVEIIQAINRIGMSIEGEINFLVQAAKNEKKPQVDVPKPVAGPEILNVLNELKGVTTAYLKLVEEGGFKEASDEHLKRLTVMSMAIQKQIYIFSQRNVTLGLVCSHRLHSILSDLHTEVGVSIRKQIAAAASQLEAEAGDIKEKEVQLKQIVDRGGNRLRHIHNIITDRV